MFGEEVGQQSGLETVLYPLHLTYRTNGSKMKQFDFEGMPVDLFAQTAETWGINVTLRTGCAAFSQWLVTERRKGGALPTGMQMRDARLYWLGTVIDTPEEVEVFEALGLDWIEPEERTDKLVQQRWRR
jgi:DNA polymerase/3'-5' exonuclease PolX